MRPLVLAAFSLGFWGAARAQISPSQILTRVAEEAAIFQENLPKAIAQETLTQQALLPPSRFLPSGGGIVTPPKPRLVSHEVISEYSVGHLKNSDSRNLFEFRQVV